MDSKSKTICPLPWTHFFINEEGLNYPCCIATEFPLPNLNEKMEPFKITSEQDMIQAWNSDYMKNIRLQMLKGERPKPCQKCYKLEDLGIASHREKMLIRHEEIWPEVEAANQDGSVSFVLRSVDLRLGNLCNLKCRMCSPVSSQRLIEDWQKLYRSESLEKFRKLDWYKEPGLWDLLLKHADDLTYLHFAGGEPFLIQAHIDFLRSLVEAGKSQHITITYNTNMTVLPDELINLWKNFKFIDLAISLDGTEKVNHYIRFPSNWSNIHKNIRFVHDNKDELKVRMMIYNITVQAYNIFDLPQLISFLISEYPRSNFPLLSPLFSPSVLSIQVLPQAMKTVLTKQWMQFILENAEKWISHAKWAGQTQEFIENIKAIVKLMNEKDQISLLPEFLRRTKVFDESRKQCVFDYIPELSSLRPLYDHVDYFRQPENPANV